MLSPVSSSLQAFAELPPPPADAASVAARCAVPARAAADLPAEPAVLATAAAKPKARAPRPKARPSGPGYAKPAATPKPGAAKPGPLAFLDDPKLSVEEKLLKLLAYLNDKWNKDLDRKMKELRTKKEGASEASGASKGKSGLGGALSKVVSVAKDVFPQVGLTLAALREPAVRSVVSGFAGPALAAVVTSMGLPELAPVALKLGPQIVDAAADLAAEAAREDGSAGGQKASGSKATSSAAEDAGPIGSDREAQLKLMEIQRIMDQQKEMFGLVSNLLRTGHEARMAVIQNVR